MIKLYKQTIIHHNFRNLSYAKLRTWYANLVKPGTIKPPYRHVIQIGDPILRAESSNVSAEHLKSDEVTFLIHQLKNVFSRYNCVGLSAPQVGIPLKVFVMEFNKNHSKNFSNEEYVKKEMSLVPFTVAINPVMKVIDYTKIIHSESCESFKGFYADVPRHYAVEVEALNENGKKFNLKLKGWAARIVQHEMDHLNGKLYTDIMDRKSLTCSCWQVINERRGKVLLPFGPQ